ncbi:uncharacterized protein VTP21DRAFT_11580 [Calcarisporiella thermophila]|uniref:uncharacterized protein n=1 Tax=Calcarisporiella thermophila TaxID=911321 RepID=UPI003743195A
MTNIPHRSPSNNLNGSITRRFYRPFSTPPLKNAPGRKYVIGVCAMDNKARSKPMGNILNRLLACGQFETVIFGDKVILDEDVKNWPVCDFLIAFFSSGFPLHKAVEYVKLRKPFCVNNLAMQEVLWDRRVVLSILDTIGVPTPPRLIVNRDGGPRLSSEVLSMIKDQFGIDKAQLQSQEEAVRLIDDETLEVGGKQLKKPFVEKPVSGEDHNIHIYYDKLRGGGGRRLFRKVANKSSEFDPNLKTPRMNGSFVYEEFFEVDNAEDVKVYTIGPNFAHAETRKSPVVDGIVRRNNEGKELRYVTELTSFEREIARKVCLAFRQTICGFDLLRVNGQSYVIDVNGWSFVKANDFYYDQCCKILRNMFLANTRSLNRRLSLSPTIPKELSYESSWRLKAFITVFRHADRTPKQKMKFFFSSKPFIDLLGGSEEEVILRKISDLKRVASTVKEAMDQNLEDTRKLHQLLRVLEKKADLPGTKVQLKPSYSKTDPNQLEKVHLVCKWGGTFTHAARYQSRDLGENLRKDLIIMNRRVLDDIKVYSSSEKRVSATADIFARVFCNNRDLPEDFIILKEKMLDDSNAAKEQLDIAKYKLRNLLRSETEFTLKQHMCGWPEGLGEPYEVVHEVIDIMSGLRTIMQHNYDRMDIDTIQLKWCCAESPELFRERWEKLFKDFCDVPREDFDPSKISELYDTLKYDSLHNRRFLETIFGEYVPEGEPSPLSNSGNLTPGIGYTAMTDQSQNAGNKNMFTGALAFVTGSVASSPVSYGGSFSSRFQQDEQRENGLTRLKELYRRAKALFDLVAPLEYGVEDEEKLEIGLLTSHPLLQQVIFDLEEARKADNPCTRLYFTKESHVHTLLNIVFLSGFPTRIAKHELPELDYLTQITFELYERNPQIESDGETSTTKEYSLRIGFSPGAHDPSILDLSLDGRHCLSVAPRRSLTHHIDLNQAFSYLKSHLGNSKLERLLERKHFHYNEEDVN